MTNKVGKLPVWCFLLLLLLSGTLQAFSQGNRAVMDQLAGSINVYTDSLLRASVYLKTSKDIYESVEDLWFKAFVLDAQYHNLFSLDKTLYVRLARADRDSTVWEEKYPVRNGVVSGHIFLDKSLPEGDYLLCAYSAHSFYTGTPYFHALKMIRIVQDTRSLLKQTPVIAVNESLQQDIQFTILPEGGQLVSGLTNTVAFKAVDKSGGPVNVTGELLQGNVPIKTFNSIHAGMGSFSFSPLPGANYQIRLTRPETGKLYALPAVQDKGVVLHLQQSKKDTLLFGVTQSPGLAKQPVYLRLQVRGRVMVINTGLLTDSLTIKLPTDRAPQGIAEVTLFDQQSRPLAERLVYLNPDRTLNITTTLSKEIYKTREKVSLKIRTADQDGNPVQASIGINVYDRIYQNSEDGKDILTHYYLSTQLKGKIYDPGYYFNSANKNRKDALDLLLLTQGWRCYLWNEDELKELKEQKQVLTDSTKGHLTAADPQKDYPKIQMLMAFSTDAREKRSIFTDNAGSFVLAPGDFVKGRWNYLQHFDTEDEKYILSVENQFSKIRDVSKNIQLNYPQAAVTTGEKRDETLYNRISLGAINLNEVRIVAKKDNVFRDKYMGHLDSLAKIEGNTDYVYQNSGFINVPIGLSGPKPTEGRMYYVWTGPNPPTTAPFGYRFGDYKRIIYHYPKFTEEELLKKYGLTRVKGYYEKREFYQPDYDKESGPLPDYRNTLLWAPEVITDKNGEATVTFFCSDINSSFTGTIEGVGDNGLLGKKVFRFNVTKE